MKLNWGLGITIVFTCFVIFMTSMAVKSYRQNTDLVAEDYYTREITYSKQMEKIGNAGRMKEKIIIEKSATAIILKFPETLKNESLSGEIIFFRPSDQKKDFRAGIEPDENGKQYFPLEKFSRGLYKVQVEWEVGGKGYYWEEAVFIEG